MSYPAKTMLVFGCYLLALGLMLLLIPNLLLGIFQMPQTSEVWVRVVGMLLLILGAYYLAAARAELRPFMAWSVPSRASVLFFFAAFVFFAAAPPVLLLFATVDLGGALWTWRALRREAPGATGANDRAHR